MGQDDPYPPPAAGLFGQPVFEQLPVLHLAVNRHLIRHPFPDRVIPPEKLRTNRRQSVSLLDDKILFIRKRPACKPEHRETDALRPLRRGDDVLLLDAGHDHLLFLSDFSDGVHPVPIPGSLFEFQVLRRRLHPFGQERGHPARPLGEQLDGLAHPFGVIFLPDPSGAGGAALADIVVQAGTLPAFSVGQRAGTGGELEDPVGLVDRFPNHIGAQVRPQIPCPVVLLELGFRYPGIRRRGYPDIMVSLVVLEQDVVFRIILLDE